MKQLNSGGKTVWFVDGLSTSPSSNAGANAVQYPFEFRAIVTSHATLGSALIEVHYS